MKVQFRSLEKKMSELSDTSEKYMDLILESASDTEVQKEYDEAEEYKNKFLAAQVLYEEIFELPANLSYESDNNTRSPAIIRAEEDSSFKLPKIEPTMFDGEVSGWLKFWSYFKKIDEKPRLSKEEKFQYLLKAMVPGSKAYLVVSSYPPTEDNYDKAITSLKNRFGREDLQTEFYMRELVQLTIDNATSSKSVSLDIMFDKLETQMRALESLGVTKDKFATVLLPLVESALPEEFLRTWQRSFNLSVSQNGDVATAAAPHSKDRLSQLMAFLESEVHSEARVTMARKGFSVCNMTSENSRKTEKSTVSQKSEKKYKNTPSAIDLMTVTKTKNKKFKKCIFCQSGEHFSADCEQALKLPYAERETIAKGNGACFNCLYIGHNFRYCTVKGLRCQKCSRRHVTLMCRKDTENESVNNIYSKNGDNSHKSIEKNLTNLGLYQEVFMKTIRVKLISDSCEIEVRAFVDSGSQNSYITKKIAQLMNYAPVSEHSVTHSLFGGQHTETMKHKKYLVRLSSLDNSYRCNFLAMDQSVICQNIEPPRRGVWCSELQKANIDINDLKSNESEVSILIGADIIGKLYTGRIVNLECGLDAMETYLGWVLFGKVPQREERLDVAAVAISLFVNNYVISDLWDLETLGIKDPMLCKAKSERDREFCENFVKTVTINNEGRFEVPLPWLECHPELSENRSMAEKRLISMTKKLKSSGYYDQYNDVFNDWLSEGVIERVPVHEEVAWGFYLPHRPVIKEQSTTKIRPVFDASAKDHQSPSLNECLSVGPNLIELIGSILLRFRMGEIGVIADIKKAFLQISVDVKDRNFLRFLWYDQNGQLIVYRHCRVVFGVNASPFILNSVINLHLKNVLKKLARCFGEVLLSLRNNIFKSLESFYIDNCVTSLNSVDQLNKFMADATSIMREAKFDLRGWEHNNCDDSDKDETSVLGIKWNKFTDALSVNVSFDAFENIDKITKRNILSIAHRIFDPLGFVCPVILLPRLLLQNLWSENLTWDDQVGENIKKSFLKWVTELKHLSEIKVPRCFLGRENGIINVSLHAFCDASKDAYATVIFLRVQKAESVNVYFVQAKNRVAPINRKDIDSRKSIPRLELMAATIGARLTKTVVNALNLKDIDIFYWSDSSTVLAWIHRHENWDVFVYNRVKEIRTLSNTNRWRFVPGELNPADLPSRGCSASQLLKSKWWEGPNWLRKDFCDWPANQYDSDENLISLEMKKKCEKKSVCLITAANLCLNEKSNYENWFCKFSSYEKLVRVTAWIKRFLFNTRNKNDRSLKSDLNFEEIVQAEITLLRSIQNSSFDGIEDQRIKHLSPIIIDGLYRLKTKILLRRDAFDFKFPIILPQNNEIVRLIVKYMHKKLNHAGTQITLNGLREKFWVLGGRKLVRSIIRECVICRRHDALHHDAPTAPLPIDRIRDASIFEIIGVDYAGPIYLKGNKKAWICLFTCAVFRAVHLELVTSLSTPTFSMALRRLIARRGRPSIVYSDNGSNFVGLDNALKRIDYAKLAKHLALEGIEWKFNPPSSPWWGGFFERLIGVLKRLLRRTLKKACLDYEEMLTVLLDCEAVINSRPITFLADNKQEIKPLSPSMFLQEIREVGVLDLDKVDQIDFNKRYVYRKKILESLRERFRSEYLGALIQFNKSKKNMYGEVHEGDLVLIECDNVKRLDWPLAIVTSLYTGVDGYKRVARLTTASGELTRPIQKIYPLEIKLDNFSGDMYEKIVEDYNKIKKSGKIKEFSKNKDNDENCAKVTTRSGRQIKPPVRLTY